MSLLQDREAYHGQFFGIHTNIMFYVFISTFKLAIFNQSNSKLKYDRL